MGTVSSTISAGDAIGQSEAFLEFQEQLSRVAPIERPLLVLGERGTGKEMAVSRVHFLSRRWQGPFVSLNCAALAPSLIETELFGHEKGAFTGADRLRRGRFETAHGGTLFLDEIGMIPLEVQEKVLRVVEYGSFERVGSSQPIDIDVRIIGATNADLKQMAAAGRFKNDLLDRLTFEVLFVPPLRKRGDDIMLLANHFADRMAMELGRDEQITFSPLVKKNLMEHPWEGNVREMKNVIERAVYRSTASLITNIVLDPFQSSYAPDKATRLQPPPRAKRSGHSLKKAVQNLEITLLEQALAATGNHQKKAAQYLGLSYDQFRGLKKKYGPARHDHAGCETRSPAE